MFAGGGWLSFHFRSVVRKQNWSCVLVVILGRDQGIVVPELALFVGSVTIVHEMGTHSN